MYEPLKTDVSFLLLSLRVRARVCAKLAGLADYGPLLTLADASSFPLPPFMPLLAAALKSSAQ